jgi:hypothetical protein
MKLLHFYAAEAVEVNSSTKLCRRLSLLSLLSYGRMIINGESAGIWPLEYRPDVHLGRTEENHGDFSPSNRTSRM